jgi:gluconokinase
MPAMTFVLSLDVGTSSTRARVYDERGDHVRKAEAQTRYDPTHGHDAHAEFDADHLVAATRAAYAEALAEGGGRVDAVALSCFWHSLLPVDDAGRAAGPLLTWRDGRSAQQAAALTGRIDAVSAYARTGCPVHPSFWPAKLLWLAETAPDLFRGAARFVSFADYLLGALAGDTRTSLSMASGTGLLDLRTGSWDEELLDVLALSPNRLPRIDDEPVDAGGLPWFPAIGDGACSNVGAGCVTPDRAALMVGTSGALRVIREADTSVPTPGLFLYRLDERRFVEGGSVSDGGNLYAWLQQTLRLPERPAIDGVAPGAGGVDFLAFLGGERSPGWRSDARGALTGLTFDTTPTEILRAALEGVALRFAEIADLLPGVREVVATGHALLVDEAWPQLVADVLERPVTLSGVDEGSCRGAAVFALERLGLEPAPAALGRVLEPRPEHAETYRSARARQRDLIRRLT